MADLGSLRAEDLLRFLFRDPRLSQSYTMGLNPAPTGFNPGDAAASMDLGGLSALQRLLGSDLSPRVRVNEAFGTLQRGR